MRRAAPLALLVLAACTASRGAAPRPDPAVAAVIARAADQVKRCYRPPAVPRAARRISTVLAVSFAPDGSLAELPRLVVQRGVTPETAAAAPLLAEAAARAVVACAPLRLPPEQYRGGWDALQLTFGPKALA